MACCKRSSTSSDSSSCFPGSATVTLRSGAVRTMSDLQIGDEVLVGARQFSPVIGFSHRAHSHHSQYVHLHTATGHTVVATTKNVMYVLQDALRVPTAAEDVVVGDLLPVLQNGLESQSIVTRVEQVQSMGLFNPHTMSGDIVVDGVVCSTYTRHVPMYAAHCLLTPVRAAYRFMSLLPSPLSA